jgi:uncharacterized membrane protein
VRERVILAAALVIAAILRFVDLAGSGYWRDEVFSVELVRMPFERMLDAIPKTEGTPPVYYVVGWLWSRLFGSTEVGLRSLSALVGVLAVLAVYLAAERLFTRRTAAVAALLAATSPLLVWYGQEARSYELGIFTVSVSLAAFAQVWARGVSPLPIGVWATAAALGIATHYFIVFVVVPEALWLLWLAWSRRSGLRIVTAGLGAVAASGLALIPLARAQQGNPGWIAARPLGRRTLEVVSEFLAGPQPAVAIVAAPLSLVCIAALAILARRAPRHEWSTAAVLASVGAAAVLVPLALALGGVDFFLARNVIFAWPALAIALAAGLGSTRGGRLGAAALATALALNIAVVVATAGQPKYGREDWRAVAANLGPANVARAFVVSPLEGAKAFEYYRLAAHAFARGVAKVREVDVVGLATSRHGVGDNPVPPRAATPPRLPGFRLALSERRTYYTIYRLRATRLETVTAAQLGRLALTSPYELEREHG